MLAHFWELLLLPGYREAGPCYPAATYGSHTGKMFCPGLHTKYMNSYRYRLGSGIYRSKNGLYSFSHQNSEKIIILRKYRQIKLPSSRLLQNKMPAKNSCSLWISVVDLDQVIFCHWIRTVISIFSGSRISDPGSRISDTGSQISDPGSRISNPYFWELSSNFFG